MQKIEFLVKKSLRTHKLETKVKQYSVCRDWESVVTGLFPNAEKKTMAISFENGILRVASLSKDIADQILVCQKRIIYALNEKIGRDLVYRIRCEY